MRFGKLRGGTKRPPLNDAEAAALERELAEAVERFRASHPDEIAAPAADDDDREFEPDRHFPVINLEAGPWHGPAAASPAADDSGTKSLLEAATERLRKYLGDVVRLLNARPSGIGRVYSLDPGADIGGLVWREGFIEYQDPRYETPRHPGAFTLHYTLFAPGSVTLAVLPAAVPVATATLMRHDLAFAIRDGGDIVVGRGEVAFAVERQIRARLEFRPDRDSGRILLEARNLDGLGIRPYHIDPAAIDAAALAQLADFIVGTRLAAPAILVAPPPA